MKYVIPAIAAVTLVALAGCDRTSTTVVKEPAAQKEKETTIVQAPAQSEPMPPCSTTTIVQPAPNVTIETSKPETTTERSRTTTTNRVDTPFGTATRSETETTKTTR